MCICRDQSHLSRSTHARTDRSGETWKTKTSVSPKGDDNDNRPSLFITERRDDVRTFTYEIAYQTCRFQSIREETKDYREDQVSKKGSQSYCLNSNSRFHPTYSGCVHSTLPLVRSSSICAMNDPKRRIFSTAFSSFACLSVCRSVGLRLEYSAVISREVGRQASSLFSPSSSSSSHVENE